MPTSPTSEAMRLVMAELDRAQRKWPGWPIDPLHAAAVVNTEAGELEQAAMKHTYCFGDKRHMLDEAVQVAATAIRFIDGYLAGHYDKRPDPLKPITGAVLDSGQLFEERK